MISSYQFRLFVSLVIVSLVSISVLSKKDMAVYCIIEYTIGAPENLQNKAILMSRSFSSHGKSVQHFEFPISADRTVPASVIQKFQKDIGGKIELDYVRYGLDGVRDICETDLTKKAANGLHPPKNCTDNTGIMASNYLYFYAAYPKKFKCPKNLFPCLHSRMYVNPGQVLSKQVSINKKLANLTCVFSLIPLSDPFNSQTTQAEIRKGAGIKDKDEDQKKSKDSNGGGQNVQHVDNSGLDATDILLYNYMFNNHYYYGNCGRMNVISYSNNGGSFFGGFSGGFLSFSFPSFSFPSISFPSFSLPSIGFPSLRQLERESRLVLRLI